MALAKDADKRTEIEWERYDKRARVFSDEQGVVTRLLRHPLFDSEQVLKSEGEPVAVEGTFPINALRFQVLKRKHTTHAEVLDGDPATKREYALEHYAEEEYR